VSVNKKKPVWETKNPKSKSKKLTPAQKSKAKSMAAKAGRKYPNLVDNMRAAKGK
jgi:ribosomal protein L15E